MKTSRVVIPKVSQSIGRNNGGTTGFEGGTAPLGPGGLLCSGGPPTGFLLFVFCGLIKLILGMLFYQKMKDELSKNERHLSIQILPLARYYDHFGRRQHNRWRNRGCSRQRSAPDGSWTRQNRTQRFGPAQSRPRYTR